MKHPTPPVSETHGQFAASARAILDALPAHVALLDSQGVIVSVNKAWRCFASANALQGPEFGIGLNYIDVCDRAVGDSSNEARAAAAGIRGVLQGDAKEFSIEYPCHAPSEPRWFRLQATPVSESRTDGVVVMHLNITERKLAELALQESEHALRQNEWTQKLLVAEVEKERARLVAAQAVAKVGSWETDLFTMNVTWSEETYRIFETDAASFQPTHAGFLDFVHPDDRARVDQAFRDSLSKTSACVVEHRVLLPDNRVKIVEDHWRVFSDDQGKPTKAIGTCQDITERKLAEESLRKSEAEFRTLAEAVPQIVWITRADGWTIYFSKAWMDYTGLTLEESLGHGWNKPFHPDDQQQAWNAWQRATATIGTYSLECRLRRADGIYRWWLIRGVPHRDAGGRILKWFGTCTDIHDLKQAQLEISHINRALQMLSSCNEALIGAEDEQQLLNQICRIVVEIGGYRMAWVGYAQDDEAQTILPVAHFGDDTGYLKEIRLSWSADQPEGRGPAGQAIRSGRISVCEDILREPITFHSQEAAQRRGYRTVICLPLRDGNRTFGLLGLYSTEVQRLTVDETRLLQELADDLAFGVTNLRSRLDRRRMQTAVVKVASGVSASGGTEFFQQLACNMAEALGAKAVFVSQLLSGVPPTGRTIAALVEGRMIDNFNYDITDTPCEKLLAEDDYVMPQKVTEHFPLATKLGGIGAEAYVGRRLISSTGLPIGHVVALFAEPLKQTDFITSTLQIFAARAASELERQQTDDKLREQAALLDATTDAVLLKDMDDNLLFWNQGAEQIYGWSAEEAIGRKSRELLAHEPGQFDPALRGLLKQGHWRGEMQKQTKDGRPLTMDVRWTLVRDAYGKPKSILAINTDITEKKKLEAQFLRAQRLESIGTLAGGVAHDLNNVLAPILMAIELLKREDADPLERELLDTLRASAQRGADLVKQVLSFARGVEGQRLIINPLHVVRDIQQIIRDTFPKNVVFSFSSPSDLWTVTGDPTQLHQVLMNLCVNARDAMPNGGKLSVTMENYVVDDVYARMNPDSKSGAYVVFTVMDSGTGIPPEIREKIFDPFFTTKDIGKGTGLGLSTTLAIVKSHGGFINLYSEMGKGTRFKIYLPATTTALAADKVAIEQTGFPRGNGEVILVVDDEESIREVALRTLERFGYRILLAVNGAEAVAQYARRQNEIAVVVTDMAMPIMDGPATIIALRALNPGVKIIGSSGLASSGGVARAVGAGVNHFVPKPYTAETMLRTIATVLKEADKASD